LKIEKILVGVDGSKESMAAADMAIDITKKYGAELIALHVVSPGLRYGYLEDILTPGLPAPLKEIIVLAMEKGKKYLDEVEQNGLNNKLKVQTEVIIVTSSVVTEIIEYSEAHRIDLIIVGSRGMSGIKKMLLGSTASGIVTYAHCPVLVVK
jgi:nucleotide-binding universal stress UspA family protein